MIYQEEIDALRDKISKYENLLEKVMDGPFMESTIISQHDGLYRVMVNGNEIIIPKSPKLNENPKAGDKVMVNKNMIICILPEELEKPVKSVEFERIKWEQIGDLKSQISQIRDAIELPIKHPDYLNRKFPDLDFLARDILKERAYKDYTEAPKPWYVKLWNAVQSMLNLNQRL